MIDIGENARGALENARALLDAMLAGGWTQVCVRGADGDYFLAREPGVENPLLAAGEGSATPGSGTMVATEVSGLAVNAPHVGTVAWLAPLGAVITKDDPVARLSVLDEMVEILAPNTGCVSKHCVQIDVLVEFSTPLVMLAG